MNSRKKFYIPVQRWLAKDQEDGEICREFPVLNEGQPLLPGREDPILGSTNKTCLLKCFRTGNLINTC